MKVQNLTTKQSLFAKEYLIDFNATQAAIRAGYSKKTAKVIGNENLTKLDIQIYLKKQIEKHTASLEIKVERVLQEQAKIAFSNVLDLFNNDGSMKDLSKIGKNTAAAIKHVDVVEIKSEGKTKVFLKKFRMQDKNKALDSLSKYLGLYQKDNEQQANADLKTKQEFMEGLLQSIAQSDRGLPQKP